MVVADLGCGWSICTFCGWQVGSRFHCPTPASGFRYSRPDFNGSGDRLSFHLFLTSCTSAYGCDVAWLPCCWWVVAVRVLMCDHLYSLVADRQPSAGISNIFIQLRLWLFAFLFYIFWRHITVHLCYVGGQITPHQLCTAINYSSGRRISNRLLVFNFRFCNFNQQQCRAGGFQSPPQTQMPNVIWHLIRSFLLLFLN